MMKATFELELAKGEIPSYDLFFGSELDLEPKFIMDMYDF